MKTRAFNQITVDALKNTLTKYSTNTTKLHDEIDYYLAIPNEIANLFPSFIEYNQDYNYYKLEYFPYSSLADSILKNKISHQEGVNIIYNLFNILEKIHSYTPDYSISKMDISYFYIKKTKDRINALEKDAYFKKLLAKPFIKINNHVYKNFNLLEKIFCSLIHKHVEINNIFSIIHGDFSLSNILYCPSKNIIKLIDPRGSFFKRGIFGHALYDYSKLMHCLHGRYDYIVNDQFQLYEFENEFYMNINHSDSMNYLEKVYIKLLKDSNFNVEFIYLIESSLFLSMASLHYENKKRQKMFYLTGIVFLNHVIEGKYENMH